MLPGLKCEERHKKFYFRRSKTTWVLKRWLRPRTKHLNFKYHHFQASVLSGEIAILRVNTHDKIADIFTKPLGLQLFLKFRTLFLG